MVWTPKIGEPSDFLVSDIVRSNLGSRPIYYSVTVPENGRAGLNNYLIYEGLVARVTPFQQPADNTGLAGSVQMARYTSMMFDRPVKVYSDAHRGLILNSYRNPDAHLSGMDEDYSMTYRYDFVRLADWAMNHGDQPTARRALDTMEALIPLNRIGMDYSFAAFLSDVADKSGNWALTQKYAAYGAKKLREQMQKPDFMENNSSARPDVQLANLDMRAGNYGEAKKQFETIRGQLKPNEQIFMDLKIKEVEARRLESEKKYDEAYRLFTEVINTYAPGSPAGRELQDLRNHAYFDSLQAKH
jgi:tetratricopeptide (TPR) repeat protein